MGPLFNEAMHYINSPELQGAFFMSAPKWDGNANEQLRDRGGRGRTRVAVYFLYCKSSRERSLAGGGG